GVRSQAFDSLDHSAAARNQAQSPANLSCRPRATLAGRSQQPRSPACQEPCAAWHSAQVGKEFESGRAGSAGGNGGDCAGRGSVLEVEDVRTAATVLESPAGEYWSRA